MRACEIGTERGMRVCEIGTERGMKVCPNVKQYMTAR